jgi:methyl-accepting chemotaxis protein
VKFQRRALAFIVAASLLVILAITLVANLLTNRLLEATKDAQFKMLRDVLSSVMKTAEDRATNRAELVVSMESVRKLFLAKDRDGLWAETERMWHLQDEKYGVDQAQFHIAPGTSFLRLHSPKQFGDDQSSYRPMLTDVNTNHVLRKGIAITRKGPIISGIVPIADAAGKHVGSFEMGLEFAPVLAKMKDAYNIEATAFVDEKMMTEIATDLKGDVMTPKNRVGRYIRFSATNPELAVALVTDKDIDVREPKNYERVVAGTAWGVQLVPMYSYSGKQIGVFALATNLADEKSDANRAIVWQLLCGLFAMVFLAGLVLVVVRGLLLRPVHALGERMKALADGDASQPADPIDSYVDELQPMAEAYEKIRTNTKPGASATGDHT